MKEPISGAPGPVMRSPSQSRLVKRGHEKAAARRVILPGYPIPPRPMTADEVTAYLGGDKITCLRCGRSFQKLGGWHLGNIHQLTQDDYRAMYGIPWSYGLASKALREKSSESLKAATAGMDEELRKRMALARSMKPKTQRKKGKAAKELTARAITIASKDGRGWGRNRKT